MTKSYNGISVSPGTETNIAIDRTYITKKSSPYSSCISTVQTDVSDSNYFIDLTIAKFGGYRQATCVKLCYQEYLITSFSCYNALLPTFNNNYNVSKLKKYVL